MLATADHTTATNANVERWTTAQWATFDDALLGQRTNTSGVETALRTAACSMMGSGMGSYMVPEQLDRLCCAWLRAAATRRALGTMVYKLHRLDQETVAALDHYEPLLRPAVWRVIDELLGFPRLGERSYPDQSSSYDAGRRMLVLRSYVLTSATGAQNPVCVNCGKHSTPYPRSWIPYDDIVVFVWCRACYHPKTITARELKTRWDIEQSALDGLDSIAASSRRGPATNEYLWAQVMHTHTDQQLARKTLKRKADNAIASSDDGDEDGDGSGGSNESVSMEGTPQRAARAETPILTARRPIAVLRMSPAALPASPAVAPFPPAKFVSTHSDTDELGDDDADPFC